MGTERPDHLRGADGLRGLACLVVMVVHAILFNYPATAPYLAGCGKIGVWLFFTLSAFLLTARLASARFGPTSLLDYAVGRVLRIYPLFLLALAVHFAVGLGVATWREFWRAAKLAAGPLHFWTIPVEMSFYVALPAIVWALRRVQRDFGDRSLLGVVLLVVGIHQVAWPFWNTPENSINLIWYLPTFLFGVTAALLRHASCPGLRVADGLVLAILASVVLATPLARYMIIGIPPTAYLMNKQLFFGLAYAMLIWCIVCRPTRLTSVFETRPMVWMGRVSYSTYLFHWIVMHQLLPLLPNTPLTVAALIVAAFGVGGLVHVLGERPLLDFRRTSMSWVSAAAMSGRVRSQIPT